MKNKITLLEQKKTTVRAVGILTYSPESKCTGWQCMLSTWYHEAPQKHQDTPAPKLPCVC